MTHPNEPPTTMALDSGYSVEAVRADHQELRLRAPDGRMCLAITLTPAGPIVQVQAAALAVITEGDLRLDAGRLDVRTREGMSLHSDGDVVLSTSTKLTTTAFEQRILSTHGDIRMQANDDIRIDGEIIHLNNPGPQEPQR